MVEGSFVQRLARFAMVLATLVAVLLLVARPQYVNWGATEDERVRSLPGDEIIPGARRQQTRAITIDVPAESVWPWLAQIDQDRGSFYSYELLEDLVGCNMTNLDRIHPQLGHWAIGDKLWMYPPSKLGGVGHAVLRAFEPGYMLGFATREAGTSMQAPENGSWSFVLESTGENRSRMLVRGRAGADRGPWGTVFDRFVFEPLHFVMERKMMTEIKARAEGRGPTPVADNLQVALWILCFGIFAVSGAASLRSRASARLLAVFVGAGGLLQLLPFVQPPLLLGTALVFALSAGLFWALEAPRDRRGSALYPAPEVAVPPRARRQAT